MFIPVTQTTERLGYYSDGLDEPVIYEAIYQSNKKRPIKFIVRNPRHNKNHKTFTSEKSATIYLKKLIKESKT